MPLEPLDPATFHALAFALWVTGVFVVWVSCLVVVLVGVRR